MRRNLLIAVSFLVLMRCTSALAFDTFWHAQETQAVGQELGFTGDATDVMKLGNFSPDLFGPVEDYAAQHLNPRQKEALEGFKLRNVKPRASAVFLHFDNLDGKLNSNSEFDYLFDRLLENTRNTLAECTNRTDLDNTTRKIVILITLGASLHAVQDFYSHSDWIHHDFDQTAVKMVRSSAEKVRAPTWFEVRERIGPPTQWPFAVRSGVYPPVADANDTHTHMNHDNSRLKYREEENPGQPLLSQAQYHNAGAVPAKPGDTESIFRHQQLAVETAGAASIEWVNLVEQNPGAKDAIESARTWEVKDSTLARELQAGLALELSLSCVAGRWDGEDPPDKRGLLCKVLQEKLGSIGGGSNPLTQGPESTWKSQLEGLVGGVGAAVMFPAVLQYTGAFWDVYDRYALLDRLTRGIASDGGEYHFDKVH